MRKTRFVETWAETSSKFTIRRASPKLAQASRTFCLALGNDSLVIAAPKTMIHSRRTATSESEIVKSERECQLAQSNGTPLDVAVLQIRRPRNRIHDDCEQSRDRLKVPRRSHKLHAPFAHVVRELAVSQQPAEKICQISHDMRRRSSTCHLSQVFSERSR
jgi:hypothetical protein